MAEDKFSGEESRKLAVLIARIWADSQLASDYKQNPDAVLRAAGINMAGRLPPQIPERPVELQASTVSQRAMSSSVSSISCASCPCSGCTASCACGAERAASDLTPHIDAIMKLAADSAGREQARKMTASWDVKLNIQS